MERNFLLNNGLTIPSLGIGLLRTPPEITSITVENALALGYRHVDTAAAYGNEPEVGTGIRNSGILREDIFVTTKLWMTNYGYRAAMEAFEISLSKLGLEYLDLYLLHWPAPAEFEKTIQSYRALEKLQNDGRIRSIGVSNFSISHLKQLAEYTDSVPAVNQIELNPFFIQEALIAEHQKLGIVTQACSPLGGIYTRSTAARHCNVHPLAHEIIKSMAERYGKSSAQIILRWHIERGFSAIPKSTNKQHLQENLAIYDFTLSEEDIAAINDLNTFVRAGSDPEAVNSSSFNITLGEC